MSRITIAQLQAFYWVAELGSVQKAAVKLNLTQPTVSLRLRNLEAELTAPVLEAHGRGVRLTRAGHNFLGKARSVLDAYARLGSDAARNAISGTLRIGLAEGFAVACLPHLVPALARRYPLLHPEWTVTTSAALEPEVVAGNLDLAVLVDPAGHRDLRLVPLGLQPNIWAGSPRLRIRAGATPDELLRFTIISTPPPTSMYRNTAAWFAGTGQPLPALCVCTSVNAAAQLAGAGIGIGIFPSRMVEAYGAGEVIRAITTNPPPMTGRVYLAHRVNADAERADAVMAVLQRTTHQLSYFGPAR